MSRPHLPTLILDALFRPSRLVTFLASGRGTTRWAALAVTEVLGVTLGLVATLGLFIPLSAAGFVMGFGFALVLAIIGIFPPLFSLPIDLPTRVRLTFGLTRSLIVTGPPTIIGTLIVYSPAFQTLQHDPFILLALLIVFGIWLGGALTVALLVSPRRSESPSLRWVGVAGVLVIGGLIMWSEPLRQTEAAMFGPLLVGLAIGLLRPLSYLWEAPLSLGLALAARLGAPAHRLLATHPVSLDDLCLLPQPGLAALLAHACATDITTGGPWLIRVAAHPSQGCAARRALARLVERRYAHTALFWLSTDQEGAAWLQQLSMSAVRPHPLIVAYAAFATVGEPAAWPMAIEVHREAIAVASSHAGGGAVRALLEAGAQVLTADRWPAAMLALHAGPSPHGVAPDQLWSALDLIREWSDSTLPALLPDRARAFAALWELIDTLDGWPAALLEAMAEHLAYLLTVEHRRGAWLL